MSKFDYQDSDAKSIVKRFRGGVRRVLYHLATGGGKTYVACKVIQRIRPRPRVLILAHRRELLTQMTRVMAKTGIDAERVVLMSPVRASRLDAATLATFGLVIVDEAHRAGGAVYSRLLARMSSASVLGLTASPYRRDGLRGEFDELVSGPDIGELVDTGVIIAPGYWSVVEGDEPDLKGVTMKAGDYNAGQLQRASNRPHLVGNIVREWQTRAKGRSTLVFASGVKHAQAIAKRFRKAHIDARVVTGKTPEAERDALVRDFDAGRFPVLVNALLLIEGFDVHRIDCLVIARATKSVVLFVQMVGRAMRPSPTRCKPIIHDHAGAYRWHGLPTTPREWSLDPEPKADVAGKGFPKAKRCGECGEVCALSAQECSACGASFKRIDEARALREVQSAIIMNCTNPECDVSGGRELSKWPDVIRRRAGKIDPKCKRCAIRAMLAARTPEHRKAIAQAMRASPNPNKNWANKYTPEQRTAMALARNAKIPKGILSAAARARNAAQTPEQKRYRGIAAAAAATPEQRRARARIANQASVAAYNALTPEQNAARRRAQSAAASAMHSALSKEDRSDRARAGHVTRRLTR